MRTDGEVAEFVIRYEGAMGACEMKRRELVDLIDGAARKPERRLFGLKWPF